jgi:hypothetical protein
VDIGPHNRLLAATAITARWRVGTAHVRHLDRVRGRSVVEVGLVDRSEG